MQYKGIQKVLEGNLITRYNGEYVAADGHPKSYEIISRNRDIKTL